MLTNVCCTPLVCVGRIHRISECTLESKQTQVGWWKLQRISTRCTNIHTQTTQNERNGLASMHAIIVWAEMSFYPRSPSSCECATNLMPNVLFDFHGCLLKQSHYSALPTTHLLFRNWCLQKKHVQQPYKQIKSKTIPTQNIAHENETQVIEPNNCSPQITVHHNNNVY